MENTEREVDILHFAPMGRTGFSGLPLNDPRTLSLKSKIRNVGRVFVTGYDINFPHDDVDRALRKLFSPCGLVTDICIRHLNNKLAGCAVVYIVGESTANKALLLSGSDVGGWKAIVKPYPFPETAGRSICVSVTGHDTLLSEIDNENALRKHFSSCGEISYVKISNEFASAEFFIDGEDAQDKVFELDGSVMGGSKLVVEVIGGGVETFHIGRHSRIIPNRGF
ncbi:hypothetical protein N665_0002s0073 [Sinapis alba]|nr:hypothetical protein N665_0002s0073 [Sinapis alba]